MKTLKYGLAVALLGTVSHAFAQNQEGALRYSQSQPVGTARTLGIAGASVAVGGDYGSVTVNPAGLGMFQKSEFTFSPGFTWIDSDARAFGKSTTDSRSNLHVASAGLVFARRRPDSDNSSPWRAGSFSLGITRTASYNRNFRYSGKIDRDQNLIKRLEQDQGSALDDLAYNTYLTERDKEGTYVPEDFFFTNGLNQEETVSTTGATTQFDLAYGASYLDKVYVGAGIGITSIRYKSQNDLTTSITEPNPNSAFQSAELREDIDTRGGGVNFRLGLIYRPIDVLRIGASVQTPTYIQFDETSNSSLQAEFSQPIKVEGKSYMSASSTLDPNVAQYALTTPFKATGGLAVVVGKIGFLSGDVEYVDYSSARFYNYNNRRYKFNNINDNIKDLQRSAVNFRVGGEARFDIFRARVGFAYYGDPYKNGSVDQSRRYVTAGLGLRLDDFFVDLAGVHGEGTSLYTPYAYDDTNGRPSIANTPVIQLNDKQFTTTVTAGFIF